MPRVFYIEETKQDLTAAKKHGTLICIYTSSEDKPNIWDTTEFMADLQEKLEVQNFNEEDYFLCAGGVISLFVTATLLSQIYENYKVLFWNTRVNEYIPRIFSREDYYYVNDQS